MNNLVDYGADSDEESPKRRSSEEASTAQKFKEEYERIEQERKRSSSDFYRDDGYSNSPKNVSMEPPAPKRKTENSPSPSAFRTPVIGMAHAPSAASLVSYSGDGDDDDDTEEDHRPPSKLPDSTPVAEIREPAPPPRKSRDDIESDEEQKLIDQAIKEGNEAVSRINQTELSPMDTPGRDSVIDSPFMTENLDKTPTHTSSSFPTDDQEIRLPPAPNVEVDPMIVARFEHAFRQKDLGTDLNQQIQGNQQYNNPMSYTTFIDTFDIDEIGSNFAKNIFDPHVFPENCYYDAIAEEQKKLTEQSGASAGSAALAKKK